MKISLADLKRAVKKIEEISNDAHINILWIDNMTLSFKDKYEAQVEIILYDGSLMMPKIRKEDIL
jgi:hypothetical protein